MKIGTRFILFLILVLFVFGMAMVSCKKTETILASPLPTDSIKDIDGNYLGIIKIGEQWWTTEDLAVTNYRDGSAINHLDNPDKWLHGKDGYRRGEATAKGHYYNLKAILHPSGLAPAGWHVATEEDWKKLETTIGCAGSELEKTGWRANGLAGKLKISSPQGWSRYGDVWSENESGFSAMAGGVILPKGNAAEGGINRMGFWWALELTDSTCYYRYMDYKNNSIFREKTNARYGMFVRCVKD